MYAFTNRYGDVVNAPAEIETIEASDVKYLPLWVAAAVKAEEDGYPSYYDRLAEAMGGPSRDDLIEAGLMPQTFTVTLTRRVPVVVWVNQTNMVDVKGNSREEAELKALSPGVTYWPGGIYGDRLVRELEDPNGYRGLYVNDLYPFGEPEIVPADTGV